LNASYLIKTAFKCINNNGEHSCDHLVSNIK
jgi:hypothetical protein